MSRSVLIFVFLLAGCLAGCGTPADRPVTVLAAASLTDVLPALQTPGVSVRYSFGASSLLVQQILHGAPADVVLTADLESQAPLTAAGRTAAGYPRAVLSNALVLLARADLPIHSVRDLASVPLHHLAACDEAVPIGHYARQAVAAAGLSWASLPVVIVGDVRAVVAVVDSGAADAGFVYRTDAAGAKNARVALAVPGIRAVYGLSILHDTPAARQYERDLQTPDNQARFRQSGFDPP